MKICVISSTVIAVGNTGAAGYSGLEHLAWQQAKGLAAKGHEVALVAPQGSSCPGVRVIETGPPGGWDEKRAFNGYWKELLDQEVVIDHAWQKWSYVLKGEGVLRCPVLGVCHAPLDTMYRSLPPNVEKACFVCISEDQRSHFEALHGRPAKTAYNGVDTSTYKPLGIARTDRYLFLARFSTIKGPDLCIEACKRAGACLDLVGDTSITGEPEYLQQCLSMCDGEKIKVIGGVTRGECVWYFSRAHCLLHLNQRFREPLGLAPVEAQLCGTPVIGWRYGALKETVAHGKTGFLVDSLDEATNLIKSNAVASLDREECRRWASQFSEEAMIDRYEELAMEAVKTGGW